MTHPLLIFQQRVLYLYIMDENKHSSDMEDKIWNLLVDYGMGENEANQCTKEILVLFNVEYKKQF